MKPHTGLAIWAFAIPSLSMGCAESLSSKGDAASAARQDHTTVAELQAQTTVLRAEVDNLRSALLEKDRRETELWQGYMMLLANVNQLMQQRAQSLQDSAYESQDFAPTSTASSRPVAVKALVRAISRLNLTTEQKQALIQLLSPPRAIDQHNPWTNVGVASW